MFELSFPTVWAFNSIALSLDGEVVSLSWILSRFTATPVEVDTDAVFVVVVVDKADVDGVIDVVVVILVVVVSDDQNDISNRSLCFGLRRCL